MSLQPGERLGSYEILAPLGAGGMGVVYRARDTRLGREVAIKLLPPGAATDPQRLARFEREAKAIAELNHPHVVTLYEVGTSDSGPYLVLEKIEGQSLRELLATGALPLKRVLTLAAQIAEGLARAHAAGIVHRDLKPENVMVSQDGFAKILDFGLARLTWPEEEAHTASHATTLSGPTTPGVILGTPAYLSPEQAAGQPADFRADQFALGALLYELVTGERPFRRATVAESIAAVIRDEPQPLRARRPELPPQIAWIVERCLAKDPADRYASTRDLARDLADLRDHLSEISRGEAVATAAAPRRLTRERVAWACAALAATAAVLLAVSQSARPAARQPSIRASILPPPGLELDPDAGIALSPDGTRLVFKAGGELWLRALSELVPRKLPGTERGLYPFWAPDGKAVAFFSGDRLYRVGIQDSAPTVVCDAPSPRGGSWGASGVILFGTLNGPLQRVTATGGVAAPATPFDGARETKQRWPSFLPDGRRFVYSAFIKHWQSAPIELRLGSLDGGPSRGLGESWSGARYALPGFVLYVAPPARTLVARRLASPGLVGEALSLASGVELTSQRWSAAFSASDTGEVVYVTGTSSPVTRPTWTDRNGRVQGVAGASGPYSELALSPDGRRAIASLEDSDRGTYDLWELDLERQTRTRLTDTVDDEQSPVWSRDGREIFYTARRGGTTDIVRQPLGTASAPTILRSTNEGTPCGVSADASRLLVAERQAGEQQNNLLLLPLAGGEPAPFRIDRYRKACGGFSADGRWVSFSSEESGRFETYIESAQQPGRRFQVSRDGSSGSFWNPRGGEILFTGLDERLYSVTVGPGKDPVLGKPQALFEISDAGVLGVARDGQRFLRLLPDPDAPKPSITLMTSALPLGR